MSVVAQGPTSVHRFPVPSFHHLIIEPMGNEDEKRPSGIIIPGSVKEKPTEGTIIAVGPGRRTPEGNRVPIEFKAGERVIFNRYAGTEFVYLDKLYLIVAEDEVKASFPRPFTKEEIENLKAKENKDATTPEIKA